MRRSAPSNLGFAALAVLIEAGRELRARWVALAIGAIVVLALAWPLHAIDHPLDAWLRAHQNETWLAVGRAASRWGELHLAPLIALVAIAVVGFVTKRAAMGWAALAGALAGITGGITVNVFKWIAGRPRPCTPFPDGFYPFHFGWNFESFPSGHSTHTMAIVAAVAVFAPRSAVGLFAGSALVMWSRWYLERHYLTDIWAGASLGVGIGLLFGLAARRVYRQTLQAAGRAGASDAKEVVPQ